MELEIRDDTVEATSVLIRTESPICVRRTDPETKKTHYYSPAEPEFAEEVNLNFLRKYFAYTGIPAGSGISLTLEEVTEKDKYVTKYKGFYITAWGGTYRLSGERKYLDFLYQCGLGSRNAQGFGMIAILEE